MDFRSLRRSIPMPSEVTYLNTGWAAPTPRGVLQRMAEVAAEEARLGPASPDGLAHAKRIRAEAAAEFGRLLNVAPDDVLLTHGTTEGVNIVLQGLSWDPDDELVTTGLEHPALSVPAAVLAERRGVGVERVTFSPQTSPTEVLDVIRRAITPRTRIVALSHVMFTCGLRMPAREIVRVAHEAGALVLLDGAQTAGHIALDLHALDVDFYAVSGQKWLMGPTGTGALYVRPDRRDLLTPLLTGPALDFRIGLRGFGLASDSTPLAAGLGEAVRLHLELVPAAVESCIMGLGQRLRSALLSIPGVTVNGPTEPETSCGLTAISVAGWEPPALADALWQRYTVAVRTVANPPGIRLSTAPFNDESDVDRAAWAVEQLARTAP